eukprot:1029872-Pleurochrysis_carterae.AAC.1
MAVKAAPESATHCRLMFFGDSGAETAWSALSCVLGEFHRRGVRAGRVACEGSGLDFPNYFCTVLICVRQHLGGGRPFPP